MDATSYFYLPDQKGGTREEYHSPVLPTFAMPLHRGNVTFDFLWLQAPTSKIFVCWTFDTY